MVRKSSAHSSAAIPGGGTCTVTVRFAPTSLGMKMAQLEVSATPGGRDVSDVSGIGITPAALAATAGSSPRAFTTGTSITPESMTFTLAATIINNGAETSGPLAISLANVVPAASTAFTTSGCAGMTLAGGASCMITITFAPTAQVAYTTDLVVTGMPGGSVTIPLSGTGSPDIELRPSTTSDYGSVQAGLTADRTFTVINQTTTARVLGTPINITSTDPAGTWTRPAGAAGGTCVAGTTMLPAAATPGNGVAGMGCTIIIRFTPTSAPPPATSTRTASLGVTATGGMPSPLSESRSLTGSVAGPIRMIGWRTITAGTNPTISACPAGVSGSLPGGLTAPATSPSFGSATTPVNTGSVQNIQLCFRNENTAGAATALISTAVSPQAADMRVVFDDCNGAQLTDSAAASAGDNCSIVVRYFPTAPTAPAGTTSTVTLSYDVGPLTTPQVVTGFAANPAALTLPTTATDFGSTVATNTTTRTVVLTNPGTVAQTARVDVTPFDLITAGTAWAVTANTCPLNVGSTTDFTVPAGMTCTLTVSFTPGTAAASSPATARLRINQLSAPTGIRTANMTGVVTPQLQIAGSSDFTTPVGTPLTRSFTITNLSMSSIPSVACNLGATAGFGTWSRNNLCAAALAGGATCTCDVTYSGPAPGGTGTATVIAQSTAGTFGTATSATLNGNAQSAAAFIHNCGTDISGSNCTPAAFNFGTVRSGTNGAFFQFRIRNTGTLASSTIMATLGTGTPAAFDLGTNTCTTLPGVGSAPANECTIDVRFSPTATGAQSTNLVVQAGAAITTIQLTGTGAAAAAVTFSPNVRDFGAGPAGTALAAQTFTVTNNTTGAVAAGAPASSSGRFAITSTTCGASLAVGASCDIVVTYTPGPVGTTGLQTANITAFGATALARGVSQAPAALALTPTTNPTNFGLTPVGTSSTAVAYTVTNTGGVPAPAINAITIGMNPAHYTVAATCNGVVLAAGASCNFNISFSPALVGGYGMKPGTVAVTAGSGGGMITSPTRNLTGQGVNPGALGITPTVGIDCRAGNMWALPSTPPNCSNTWTLSNTGDVAVTAIARVIANPDFTITGSGTCANINVGTATLAANDSAAGGPDECVITAAYNPLTIGADASVLITINSANGGSVTGTVSETADSPLVHTASGAGGPGGFTAGSLPFTPAALAVGATRTRTVTITNGGGGIPAMSATGTLRYSITGDFRIVGNAASGGGSAAADTCTGNILNNNVTCTMTVEFLPSASGVRTGVLTVDDGTAERRVVINLTGN